MNRRVRRALLTFCGGFFLLVAPVVVLYAVGYRFVSTNEEAKSVGVLLTESIPKGAQLFINGEEKGRTPKAVPGLSEGNVAVRVEKEGYVTWQKELPIFPIRATEARTIRLFAENPEITTVADGVQSFNLAPNRRLLAVLETDNTLHILDVQGQKTQASVQLQQAPREILWSPDSSSLLLRTGNTYSLLQTSASSVAQELPALTNMTSVTWDPRLPGRLLALTDEHDLISYSTATASLQVLAQQVDQFVPTTRNLITITGENTVTWYSLLGSPDKQEVFKEAITSLLATPSGMISVYQADGSVSVLTRDGQTVPVTSSGYAPIGWSPDGTTLLLQAGMSEMAVFNVENERAIHIPLQKLHTILRLSRPINHPQWFAGGTHIVFQQDDEIVISEVDTRDHPIQFTADSTNTGDAQVVVGEDGNVLLYVKVTDGRRSLVSRPLVLPADQ